MRAPARYIAAYCGWLASTLAWSYGSRALLRLAAAQHPNLYTPATIRPMEGFLLLAGMILLHPACYGIARLIYRAPIQSPERSHRLDGTGKATDLALKQRRNALRRFGATALAVLGLGAVAEFVFHIPRFPFEYYLSLCALLAGIALAVWQPLGARNPVSVAQRGEDIRRQPVRANLDVPRDQIDPATGRSIWARPDTSGESALPKGTHLSQPDLSQKPARATANVPRDQIDPATGRSVWARPE